MKPTYKQLETRLEKLETEREAILEALPDDATCKYPETSESLLDNIRDLVAVKGFGA